MSAPAEELNKQSELAIIKKLVEIDRQARKMVAEAADEKEKTVEALEQEKKAVHSNILERAQSRIEKIKTESSQESEKTAISIEDEGSEMMKRLETSFSQNSAKWEGELFNRCIGALK